MKESTAEQAARIEGLASRSIAAQVLEEWIEHKLGKPEAVTAPPAPSVGAPAPDADPPKG
jgi:hypothetical protein